MVRATGVKMPSFCLNRIKPHVRVRSPNIQFKLDVNPTKTDPTTETSGDVGDDNSGDVGRKPGATISRKIMIVVDSSIEAKNALQWALTRTLQNQDILILLYVTKAYKQGDERSSKEIPPRVPDFLCSMKNMCRLKRPEVQIEMVVAEGKEKGATIVEEAKKKEVAMLVLGQKKRSVSWRLLMIWAGNNRVGEGVAEYCIQNASCMAIAVRRKSKKVGGYLITTKSHRDFWLLA